MFYEKELHFRFKSLLHQNKNKIINVTKSLPLLDSLDFEQAALISAPSSSLSLPVVSKK